MASEPFDQFMPNWRHFVQGAIAINSRYIIYYDHYQNQDGRWARFGL
jgi:hypothetical protein